MPTYSGALPCSELPIWAWLIIIEQRLPVARIRHFSYMDGDTIELALYDRSAPTMQWSYAWLYKGGTY